MKRLTDFCAHGVNVAIDSCGRCAAEVRAFKAEREATIAELPIRHRAAMAAMQGMWANADVVREAGKAVIASGGRMTMQHAVIAKMAVDAADALLEALAK